MTDERIVKALESIAESLVKIANPLFAVPAGLPVQLGATRPKPVPGISPKEAAERIRILGLGDKKDA